MMPTAYSLFHYPKIIPITTASIARGRYGNEQVVVHHNTVDVPLVSYAGQLCLTEAEAELSLWVTLIPIKTTATYIYEYERITRLTQSGYISSVYLAVVNTLTFELKECSTPILL